MSNARTIPLQRIDDCRVTAIAANVWDAFCRGGAPLRSHNGRVDLLLVTLRDGVCEEIDPLTLSVDRDGYLLRIEVGLRPLPDDATVFDARLAFLRRYFKHVHRWTPSEELIQHALILAQRAARA